MTRATHRVVTLIVLVLVVCAGPWGCALKHPQGPQSPTDEVRAQIKTIGLPVAGFPPEAHVDAPTSGKGMGALKGAGVGLAVGAAPGMAIAGSIGKGCNGGGELGAVICGAALVFGLGVAAAGGTIGALGGTVYGAVTAESGSKVDAAQAELKSALIQADVQMMLRNHVLEMVRDSQLNFVAVDDEDRGANGQPIDYKALASTSIDTVLQVSVPQLGLAGESGINPPIKLFMTARARLVRTADGVEMYAEKFDYRSDGTSKFLEWAADEAQMFRQEIERGTRTLAEDIVRLVFPAEPVRDSAPAEQSATLPSTPIESIAESPATSSELPSKPVNVAVAERNESTPSDAPRAAMIGTWLGTFRPAEGSQTYPARLRVFEDGGQIRWELTRSQAGRDLAGSGVVSVADATVTLTGTYQPSPGSLYQRAWAGSQPIDVTYSLRRYGASLIGSGLGADNRVETLMLMRAAGQ